MRTKKRGLTLIEVVAVIALLLVLTAFLVPALSRMREASRRASCQNNMKQWGTVLGLYSAECRRGSYPRPGLDGERDVAMGADPTTCNLGDIWATPAGTLVYPEYISDLAIYFCPADKTNCLEDHIGPDGYKWFTDGQTGGGVKPENGGYLHGAFMGECSYVYCGYMTEDDDVWMTMISATDIMCKAVRPEEFAGVSDPTGVGAHELSVADAALKLSQDLKLMDAAQVCGNHTNTKGYVNTSEPQWKNNLRAWCHARCNTYMLWPYLDKAGMQGVWHAFKVKGSGVRNRQNVADAKIYVLREGVERWLLTDVPSPGGTAVVQSTIAVMWEQAEQSNVSAKMKLRHAHAGANVLYMDGHVAWVKYPHNSLIPCTVTMGAAGVNW